MPRGRTAGWIAALAALAATAGPAQEYILAKDGISDARIQMNPTPSPSEFAAAAALQDYLYKISGARPVRSTYPPRHHRLTADNPRFTEILLITLENGRGRLPPAVAKALSEAASSEAFYIKTDGARKIIIAGKQPVGVLYGAFSFLETYLGVRWFYPGEEGEVCPKAKTIAVGEIDDFQQPAFAIKRGINAYRVKWYGRGTLLSDWFMRNKMGFPAQYQLTNLSQEQLAYWSAGNARWGGGGHLMFESSVPIRLFADTHPEYFPLIDGKRHTEQGRFQRCLSHPDVQQLVRTYCLDQLAYAGRSNYRFCFAGHDQQKTWCLCPACVRLGTHQGVFDVSTMVHRSFVSLSGEILRTVPEAKLAFTMYADYRDLPRDPALHYDPRVVGTYAPHGRCYAHRLDDPRCEINVRMLKDIVAWHAVSPTMEFYEFMGCANSSYAAMEYVLASDLKLYKKLGLDGGWMDDCCEPADPFWETSWPLYYVAAKMLWDPARDVVAILEDAYDAYYGPAAAPMKRYHALRRELWDSAPGHATYGGAARIGYCLTVPRAEQRLNAFLDEADCLAAADAMVKRRIAFDREYLTGIWGKHAAALRKIMSGQNNVPVRETEGPIAIDGALAEADWIKAPLVTGFRVIRTGAEPKEETRVKVLYDKANWYIGIEAMTEHAWSPLKASVTNRDGAVWEDDSVEVFLAPPGGDYCHWVVNSLGACYDAKLMDKRFDSQAEIAVTRSKDRYTVELRIPADRLGSAILPGQIWQLHFIRTCLNLQPPHGPESAGIDGVDAHRQLNFRRALIEARWSGTARLRKSLTRRKRTKPRPTASKARNFQTIGAGQTPRCLKASTT